MLWLTHLHSCPETNLTNERPTFVRQLCRWGLVRAPRARPACATRQTLGRLLRRLLVRLLAHRLSSPLESALLSPLWRSSGSVQST